ncbi:type IV toxin-antitoxin system AbiEi family antitoxin domain-containing protein [Agreia sp. VKM Ac-1783]|uniref:type IV toxin-antitoxin system AbiEi family antitoxin domain-containing protein n=1 Tax=Agreia sp. VKM Ac-1783 TaxID=1938889 RepID=UPI0011243514
MSVSSRDLWLLQDCVRRNGNVASRRTLLEARVDSADIDVACRSGRLERLRRGMYALPEADIDQRRAVLAGGRVGCVSALRRVGVWGGLDRALHIHVPASASRLHLDEIAALGRSAEIRRTDKAFWAEPGRPRVHWQRANAPTARSWAYDWLVDPMSALRQAVLCLDDEHAIAAIDSALRKKVVRDHDLESLFTSLPRRLQRMRLELDPAADSGPESIVRVRMRRAGFEVEPQASIPGSSDLDLLINGVVGLDIDSRAWHTGEEQTSWDYGKTLQSFAFGRPTLRILPHHIFDLWPSTLAAISRVVSDAEELHRLRRMNRNRSTG